MLLRWAGVLAAAIVLAALSLELGFRVGIGVPAAERLPLLRVKPDSQLGYRPLPGDVHYSYSELVVLNRLGLRGPPPSAALPTSGCRIILLGDSQVYGMGVADSDLVSAQLEDALAAISRFQGSEVLNFGVRGYAVNQQIDLLSLAGAVFEPDIVVLVIFQYSLYPRDTAAYYRRVAERDWFMLDLDAKPEGSDLWKWRVRQLARRSAALSWLHDTVAVWRGRDSWLGDLRSGRASTRLLGRFKYLGQELDRFAQLGRTKEFEAHVLVLPLPEQLRVAEPSGLYQAEVIRRAEAKGLTAVDVLDVMRQARQRGARLLVSPFSAHYSADAHGVIAAELLQHLRSRSGCRS